MCNLAWNPVVSCLMLENRTESLNSLMICLGEGITSPRLYNHNYIAVHRHHSVQLLPPPCLRLTLSNLPDWQQNYIIATFSFCRSCYSTKCVWVFVCLVIINYAQETRANAFSTWLFHVDEDDVMARSLPLSASRKQHPFNDRLRRFWDLNYNQFYNNVIDSFIVKKENYLR